MLRSITVINSPVYYLQSQYVEHDLFYFILLYFYPTLDYYYFLGGYFSLDGYIYIYFFYSSSIILIVLDSLLGLFPDSLKFLEELFTWEARQAQTQTYSWGGERGNVAACHAA